MIGALGLVIFRDWRIHKLRLTLTLAGIALGVAVFFAIKTANETLVGSLNGTIEKLAGKATLQVVAGDAGFSKGILDDVKSIAGVQIAEPVTETIAETTIGANQRILILGLDTTSDLALYNTTLDQEKLIVKNPLAFSNRKDSVAITSTLAQRFNLKDGDKFTVNAQTGPLELTIRGIFSESGIGEVYDGNVAVMDIYSAQDMFGRGSKIDRIDIVNDPAVSVENLQRKLAEQLPGTLDIVRPNLRGKSLENTISTMHVAFSITGILALMTGVFLIFNSFSTSLKQRWKEIAILRALGVERGNIGRMFVIEAMVLGLVGSAAGVAIGFLMARMALGFVIGITAVVYGFESAAIGLEFNFRFAVEAFVLGVVVSVIAAWLPSRSAASLEPTLALHNIETRTPDHKSSRLIIVVGLISIIGGLLLTKYTPPSVGSYVQMTYPFAIQIGMILLLPQILKIGAKVLRPVLSLVFGAEGVMAVETMANSPRRTVATVGAIVIGLSFVFSSASLILSQRTAINRSIDKAIAADILVTSSDQLQSRTHHFTEQTARKVSNLPEVETANEVRVTTIDFEGAEVSILAHDMQAYFKISPDLLDIGDPATAREITARGEGILVSNNLALKQNLKMGDSLTIRAPLGEIKLPIVGMLDYYRAENGSIFLDRNLYKKYWDDTDVDYIFLDLKAGVERIEFKDKAMTAIAGTQRAFIYTHEEYKAWVSKLIDQFFLMMYMQMAVAIIVAAIGLINTMLISVAERRRELGVFRAIGGLRRQVVKMVLLEAVCVAVIGFVVGVVTGAMNAYFLVTTAVKIVAGFDIKLIFPYTVVGIAIPLVIFVALVSAWFPAWRASRLNVVEAIGYE